MSYSLDPELVHVLAASAGQAADVPVRQRGDWKTMREEGNLGQAAMAALGPPELAACADWVARSVISAS